MWSLVKIIYKIQVCTNITFKRFFIFDILRSKEKKLDKIDKFAVYSIE